MTADIGVYGLGTMGSALALNLADSGFRVAVTNREVEWIDDFVTEAADLAGDIDAHKTLESFVQGITAPRTILFMIPSTKPMDDMIARITPLLSDGDTIIDGGNADFNDTRRRFQELEGTGIHFVGMGVSGGEYGARHGPSMMVGGSDHSWAQFKPMAEAMAAKFEGAPCVDHLGPDGAGHFVKTVHNGIEYADMQMIAEAYGLMRDVGQLDIAQMAAHFGEWSKGPLASYLIDITAAILRSVDSKTGAPMVDVILDQAGQKGTGRWTLIEALRMGISASTIEAAVGARSWSSEKEARMAAGDLLPDTSRGDAMPEADDVENALMAGRIIGHAQGFQLMRAASEEFGWGLNMPRIAEIWRAGCIIRSALLDDLAEVMAGDLPQGHVILAPAMAARLADTVPGLRRVVSAAVMAGQPVPALSAALAWYDTMALGRGTANMIQAQRDFFGAHGFARLDDAGKHHGDWVAL
ncbi:MAG: NADP-dependent phosphogluconate dehydrogenase [Rhodobacteraceae bacterium]|nr:NADP-dependent phosphogluconate dehydrogenase [Paracoccaceae bacterium]